MTQLSGRRLESQEVARVAERLSFVYLERCTVSRDDNAVTATDESGVIHIPSAGLGCLMLGPGTRVTYAAMALLGDSGVSVVWVGENGIRYYAHGRPLARSTRLLVEQAKLVSNTRSRLSVARQMYTIRFPGEDVSALSMQQLRGREGARIRRVYREHAERTGVEWTKRDYDPQNFEDSDDVNKALTSANACLYGIVQSVVVALGCAPGLGFVHSGTDRAFVYDIADLYKADITIPAAFAVVAEGGPETGTAVRRLVRDLVTRTRLLETCAQDITELLTGKVSEVWEQDDELSLWSGVGDQTVASGMNYAEKP